MSESRRKSKKRRPRKRPPEYELPQREKPALKIADTPLVEEQEAIKAKNYLPEPVTVFINGEATELKTLEDFTIAAEGIYSNYLVDRPQVEIDVDNALSWHAGSIQGVINFTKSYQATFRRKGMACALGDIFDVLLQTSVDASNMPGYRQFKHLMLQVSARYYEEQEAPRIVSLKERLKDLGFKGDDLRTLKRKEKELRIQAAKERVDKAPAYLRTPISELIPEMPIPKQSRQIVVPGLFTVTHEGVGYEVDNDQTFLRTPLVITSNYKDRVTEAVSVKLVFRYQRSYVSIVVSRESICDKRKLLSLSKFGLPVTEDNVMDVVRYLQAFEHENQHRIEHCSTTNRLGVHHIERRVPKVDTRGKKLSKKTLSRIEERVIARSKKDNPSVEVSIDAPAVKSMFEEEVRLTTKRAAQRAAAKLLRECEEAELDGYDPPELLDGFEKIKTTVFILKDKVYSSHFLEPNICFQSSEAEINEQVAGFRCKGELEAWIDLVKLTEEYPQVRLAIVAAFAPLLRIFIEFENLILDFCGRTTSGKTTTLRLAAAGFGCPNQSDSTGSVIFSLAGTATFNERRAGLLRNLPLFLDESKLAEPGKLSKFAYMLASGTSKGRGTVTGVQQMTKFETIGIFTGEQPIVADSKDGGAKVRAVPFFGGPFGDESPEIGQLADQINETVEHNYGHALPGMLEFIFDNQVRWPSWKNLFEGFKTELKGEADDVGNKYAARLSPALAAFKLMEHLLEECFKIPSIDVVEANWDNFVLETSVADQSKLALETVYNFAVQHREHFWDHGRTYPDNRREPPRGWLGRWDLHQNSKVPDPSEDPQWPYIGFITAEIKVLLADQGFDADAVLRQWKLDDVLVCDSGRNDHQVTFGVDKNRIRLVCISKSAIDALDCFHDQTESPADDAPQDGIEDDHDDAEDHVDVDS